MIFTKSTLWQRNILLKTTQATHHLKSALWSLKSHFLRSVKKIPSLGNQPQTLCWNIGIPLRTSTTIQNNSKLHDGSPLNESKKAACNKCKVVTRKGKELQRVAVIFNTRIWLSPRIKKMPRCLQAANILWWSELWTPSAKWHASQVLRTAKSPFSMSAVISASHQGSSSLAQ